MADLYIQNQMENTIRTCLTAMREARQQRTEASSHPRHLQAAIAAAEHWTGGYANCLRCKRPFIAGPDDTRCLPCTERAQRDPLLGE